MGVFRYQGYYLGTPAMYHATSGVKNYPNTDGYHLVQLACSRDLKTWHRLGNRSPFIGPSPLSSGAYDLAQIIGSSNVILRDDELWFYYTGLKYRNTWDYVGEYPDGEHIPVTGFDSDIGLLIWQFYGGTVLSRLMPIIKKGDFKPALFCWSEAKFLSISMPGTVNSEPKLSIQTEMH
ncbi:TPA: hypothetical protein EYO57_22930 [Candidatus Poribacteria bacterium]|nr:hypothetical protein [Candidatus Poribacteria bacterium]